jgi:proteasome lid subunit RPN8/RPN11
MDEREQVEALLHILGHGWDVLAIYHSHPPGGPAELSLTDITEASFPDALLMIARSTMDGELVQIAAFAVEGKRVRQVPLIVADPE